MNALRKWLGNFRGDLTGPSSHRVCGVIIVTLVGAYAGLHTVFEARHDRQMNESLFERDIFTTLVSSGARGDFIAGMKDFGRIQRMSIRSAPGLWEPLGWWCREQPNMEPLWRWAKNRLEWCEKASCGDQGGGKQGYRINLRTADLKKTKLKNVELNESDLRGADLRWADLEEANLEEANLEGADLKEANLRGIRGIQCSDLKQARNWEQAFRSEVLACGAEIPSPVELSAIPANPDP